MNLSSDPTDAVSFTAHSEATTADIGLLEQIERDPDVTQASLADRLGVAVGTVNWHLKRLIAKGYVKVKRAERKKLKYIITPEGIAFRALLTVDYIEQSMLLYRNTRQKVRRLLQDVKQAGYTGVCIDAGTDERTAENVLKGNASFTDIVDICRLSCLEQGIKIVEATPCIVESAGGAATLDVLRRSDDLYRGLCTVLPCLQVRGLSVSLHIAERTCVAECTAGGDLHQER